MHYYLKIIATILIAVFLTVISKAQFAPAAGLQGSTAVSKDDESITEWATGCTVIRGWQDIADTTPGLATVGTENAAIGAAGTNGIVSLGDGGSAILTFDKPIYNGPGFDFAVFENGFSTGDSALAFLELAFVEVSSDGVHFYRFPAICHIQDTLQLPMVGVDCSLVNNLAGSYVANYGTPFDLDELKNEPGLDVNHITHVKVVDVVGSIDDRYATYDSEGNKINNAYPTPYPSSGFDLDAVAVMNADETAGVQDIGEPTLSLLPNPYSNGRLLKMVGANERTVLSFYSATGELVFKQEYTTEGVKLPQLPAGLYFVKAEMPTGSSTMKLIVR